MEKAKRELNTIFGNLVYVIFSIISAFTYEVFYLSIGNVHIFVVGNSFLLVPYLIIHGCILFILYMFLIISVYSMLTPLLYRLMFYIDEKLYI